MTGGHRRLDTDFVVSDDFELPAALSTSGPDAMELSELVLVTTDWDTADRDLAGWGHRLAHRQSSDGSERRWILTLRSGPPSNGSAPPTLEVIVDAPPTEPPGRLRTLVAGVTLGRPLVPASIVTIHRSRRILRGGRVELSDDAISVQLTDDHRTSRSRRVHLRSIHAQTDRDLRRVSRALLDGGAGATTETPDRRLPLAWERTSVELGRNSDVGTVVRSAIVSGVQRLRRNDPLARLDDQVHAIHQCRVATRRLRSDLASLAPVLDPDRVRRLRQELRWIAGSTGAVRDLDVLAVRLDTQRRRLDPADAHEVQAILDAVRRERRQRHSELIDDLGSERYVALIEDLLSAGRQVPFGPDAAPNAAGAPLLRQIVRAAWKRTLQAARRLDGNSGPSELHALRRRAKRVRAAALLAAPVIGSDARRFAKRLGALQDALGAVNDSVVARHWLEARSAEGLPAGTAFVAGRIAEREARVSEDLQAAWPATWDRLQSADLTRWLN